MPFTCACCGKTFPEIPLCFGSDYPEYYYSIPERERIKKVTLTESLCLIDGYYFHRGRITIPILDFEENLTFNVWTSLSKENFELRNDLWNNPLRINQEPYFGWLQTRIPTYENTINIKTMAYENEPDFIPTIEVFEENHPLTNDQQHGLTYEIAINKVQEILKGLHKA